MTFHVRVLPRSSSASLLAELWLRQRNFAIVSFPTIVTSSDTTIPDITSLLKPISASDHPLTGGGGLFGESCVLGSHAPKGLADQVVGLGLRIFLHKGSERLACLALLEAKGDKCKFGVGCGAGCGAFLLRLPC